MDNLPLLIYVAETIPRFAKVASLASILLTILFGFSVFILLMCKEDVGSKEELEKWDRWVKSAVKGFVTSILISILLTLVPTQKTIYLMVGVGVGVEALQSETGQEITGEVGTTVSKALKLLNQKLDEQVTEE